MFKRWKYLMIMLVSMFMCSHECINQCYYLVWVVVDYDRYVIGYMIRPTCIDLLCNDMCVLFELGQRYVVLRWL
jgi:hypothetical protein